MAKKKSAAAKPKPAKRVPAKPKVKAKPKAKGKAKAKAKPVSLGRPLVTAEEKLYLLFKDDYPARQIFEFLRVDTVGQLEAFAPGQIVDLLSKPIRQTVDRMRAKLAEKHRHLRDDLDFAVARQSESEANH